MTAKKRILITFILSIVVVYITQYYSAAVLNNVPLMTRVPELLGSGNWHIVLFYAVLNILAVITYQFAVEESFHGTLKRMTIFLPISLIVKFILDKTLIISTLDPFFFEQYWIKFILENFYVLFIYVSLFFYFGKRRFLKKYEWEYVGLSILAIIILFLTILIYIYMVSNYTEAYTSTFIFNYSEERRFEIRVNASLYLNELNKLCHQIMIPCSFFLMQVMTRKKQESQ